MRKLVILISLFQFISCGTKTTDINKIGQDSKIETTINVCYNKYKSAIANGKGLEAANLVSNKTIQYYNSVIDLVKNADSIHLVMASLLDKFTVLAIRETVDWKKLRAMDGKDLFVYAIENGMIGKDIINSSIGSIDQQTEYAAKVELVINGNLSHKFTFFYKEDEVWRIDLIEILKENEKSLKKMIQQPNMNESESLLLFFKQTFGRFPRPELWLPVMKFN